MRKTTSILCLILYVVMAACSPPGPSRLETVTQAPVTAPPQIPSATVPATIPPTPTPPAPPFDTSHPDIPIASVPGPEGSLYQIGIGWREEVAVSPNERLMALPANSGMYVYAIETFELQWRSIDYPWLSTPAWSPDGSRVAALASGDQLVIFDAISGVVLQAFPVRDIYPYEGNTIQISPDNQQVVVNQRLYSTTSGQQVSFNPTSVDLGSVYTATAAFVGNVLRAAVPCHEAVFCIWHSDTDIYAPYSPPGSQQGGPLSISPDGRWVLLRTEDDIRLFDFDTQTYLELPGLGNLTADESEYMYRREIRWAFDSSAFTIQGYGDARLFQTGEAESLQSWPGSSTYDFVWSTDSDTLAKGYSDTTLYSVGNGQATESESYRDNVARAILSDGRILWRGYELDGAVGIGLTMPGQEEFAHSLWTDMETFSLISAAWTPDNHLLMVADYADRMLLFDAISAEPLGVVDTRTRNILSSHHDFQWSADGKYLAWRLNEFDDPIPIMDWRTGSVEHRFTMNDYEVANTIALDRSGTRFLLSGFWGTIALFDVQTGEMLDQTAQGGPGSNGNVDLAWSPDSSQFASIEEWKTIEPITVWDAENLTPLYTLMPDWESRTPLWTINWSGNLIAAYGRNSVFVWDATTQELLWFATNPSGVDCGIVGRGDIDNQMALTEDGRYLAAVIGGSDGTCQQIAVYNGFTGELLHAYPGSMSREITRLVWSADGEHLASVNLAESVVVWDTSLLPPVDIP